MSNKYSLPTSRSARRQTRRNNNGAFVQLVQLGLQLVAQTLNNTNPSNNVISTNTTTTDELLTSTPLDTTYHSLIDIDNPIPENQENQTSLQHDQTLVDIETHDTLAETVLQNPNTNTQNNSNLLDTKNPLTPNVIVIQTTDQQNQQATPVASPRSPLRQLIDETSSRIKKTISKTPAFRNLQRRSIKNNPQYNEVQKLLEPVATRLKSIKLKCYFIDPFYDPLLTVVERRSAWGRGVGRG